MDITISQESQESKESKAIAINENESVRLGWKGSTIPENFVNDKNQKLFGLRLSLCVPQNMKLHAGTKIKCDLPTPTYWIVGADVKSIKEKVCEQIDELFTSASNNPYNSYIPQKTLINTYNKLSEYGIPEYVLLDIPEGFTVVSESEEVQDDYHFITFNAIQKEWRLQKFNFAWHQMTEDTANTRPLAKEFFCVFKHV